MNKYYRRNKWFEAITIILLILIVFLQLRQRVDAEQKINEPVIEQNNTIDELLVFEEKDREKTEAMYDASKKYDVPFRLLLGIANAESGIGKYFAVEYDRKNCHNYYGIKGGNAEQRTDGSYLRCFDSDIAGAETVAKTLRLYYLDEGRTTPEQICQKWIGSKHAEKNCPEWIANVKQYYDERTINQEAGDDLSDSTKI